MMLAASMLGVILLGRVALQLVIVNFELSRCCCPKCNARHEDYRRRRALYEPLR